MKRILAISAVLLMVSAVSSRATLYVRELWDNVTNGAPAAEAGYYLLQHQGNGTTTFGLQGIWNVNSSDPAATNALLVNYQSDVYEAYYALYPDEALNWGALGCLMLPQPNTNRWDSGTWATRLMAVSSWINMNSNSTNYFAFRWVKRSFYYPVNGTNGYGEDDAGLGVGFAAGATPTSAFIGIGVTRSEARYTYDGMGYTNLAQNTDLGDTPYVTWGTLGQAGYPEHPGDSGGPYYVRSYAGDLSGSGVINQCSGYTGNSYPAVGSDQYMWGGIMVGRIVTSVGGMTEIDVKNYSGQDTVANVVDNQPNPVTGWDAVSFYTNTVKLEYLTVWMYGNNNANPCAIDGIRMASTWAEVLGEDVTMPTISLYNSTNTYFQGTPLTLSGSGSIDYGAAWYEWLYNSNAATLNYAGTESNSFPLTSPVIANTGYYSLAFSNGWEQDSSPGATLIVTSPPVFINIIAPSAPIITAQPQPGGRYSAAGTASFNFNVSILGTPPFTYKWYQIAGGVTNLVQTQSATNASTSSYALTAPISTSAVGNYYVNISNPYGSTNSIPAAFNVFALTPGSYAAQVVSNTPWAYWRLDENYGTTNLHDYFGGNDGSILDPTNVVTIGTNPPFIAGVFQQQPAAPYAGFPANHVGLYMPLVFPFPLARVDLPGVTNYTSGMTWMGWVYSPNPYETIWGESPFFINRDYSGTTVGASGYGNNFGLGLMQVTNAAGAVTQNNELFYRWGGPTENPNQPWLGYYFKSGLFVPTNSWWFVAVSWVAPNNATLYLGNSTGPLSSVSATLPSFDPNYPGSTYSNTNSILLGREGYPWTESQGSAQDYANVYMSDVAIFTNALSATTINQIYFAAMGEAVSTTNSPTGRVMITWPEGTLLSSTNVLGPYTQVVGATSPYPVPSPMGPQRFYRVQR
jgi:hypothetical protein